jgi:hypothetical protein
VALVDRHNEPIIVLLSTVSLGHPESIDFPGVLWEADIMLKVPYCHEVIPALAAYAAGALVMGWALLFFCGKPRGFLSTLDVILATLLWPIAMIVIMVRS